MRGFIKDRDRELAESIEGLFRAVNKWMKSINREYFCRNDNIDITLNQYRVLYALKNHGPYKMSEFGEHIRTSCGSLTVMMDRLVEKGLVERFFLPEDRRVVMVRITPAGDRVLEEYREGFLNILIDDVKKLNDAEKQTLWKAAQEIRAVMDKITD